MNAMDKVRRRVLCEGEFVKRKRLTRELLTREATQIRSCAEKIKVMAERLEKLQAFHPYGPWAGNAKPLDALMDAVYGLEEAADIGLTFAETWFDENGKML